MNMNEVLATLATRHLGADVHPNDHVNASQSSNDVFPTSVHVAATSALSDDLVPALEHLAAALEDKAAELADVVTSGRTHLMDATPVTLGQEFAGWAAQVRRGVERVQATLPRVAEVPLGGTAVGTGINTPPGFAAAVVERLAAETGLPVTEARDHFEAQGARDGLVEASGALRTVAVSLTKVCNDLRWKSSGSDDRPGRDPPAGPPAGQLDHAGQGEPGPAGGDPHGLLAGRRQRRRRRLGGGVGHVRAERADPRHGPQRAGVRAAARERLPPAGRPVRRGIEADVERCRAFAESSPSIVTPLNRVIGYEAAAKVAKHALAQRITIKEAVVALGHVDGERLTEEQLDAYLDVTTMTGPAGRG